MKGSFTYLDSSALIKLVVAEPQTQALRRYLAQRKRRITSGLARTEVQRAAARVSPAHLGLARRLLADLEVIELDRVLLDQAGGLSPAELRSLDAIHLAAALCLGDELADFVTYDLRQAEAASQWGLAVSAPA
ncbi:MAG: type II toxin-antitoxin system VapC family toxin [Candidatus Dormibacteraeota bacterium]|nr:type II toxin-antitoxin system VapC family toxin [Candidatus Dormibacteraeota bacterium]